MDFEWLKVFSPLTFIAVVVAAWQLRATHERGRREYASKLIWDWALNSKQNTNVTIKLIHQLDRHTCANIFNQEPAEISAQHKKLLTVALTEKGIAGVKEEGTKLLLDIDTTSHLRSLVTKYLNLTEAIFVAWEHGIADKKIIEKEFEFVISRGTNQVYLWTYLEVCEWATNYPAIYCYVKHKTGRVGGPRPPVFP
jgi:hypothetical protein